MVRVLPDLLAAWLDQRMQILNKQVLGRPLYQRLLELVDCGKDFTVRGHNENT
jgi:hypothetical protein